MKIVFAVSCDDSGVIYLYPRYLPIYVPWVPKYVCRRNQDILLTRQKWQSMTGGASDALKC